MKTMMRTVSIALIAIIDIGGCGEAQEERDHLQPSATANGGCQDDQSYRGGCADPPPEQTGDTSSALGGGQFTYARPEVGALETINGRFFCTGTLVSANAVLTAAHCIRYKSFDAPGRVLGYFRVDLLDQSPRYAFDAQIAFGTDLGENDVALIRLLDQVPPLVAVPATLASSVPPERAVTIFGYGRNVRTAPTILGWDSCEPGNLFNQKQWLQVQSGWTRAVCPGDSGGPTFDGTYGPVFRVTSGSRPGSLFGLGPSDFFGDVVKHRAQVLNQIDAWQPVVSTGKG